MSRGEKRAKLERRYVAYVERLRSSSPVQIPATDFRWVGLISSPNRTRTFGVKSPLTNNWIDFDVPDQFFHAKMPTMESGEAIDFYKSTLRIVNVARDYAVFKDELQALSDDEARIFGAIRPTSLGRKRDSRRFGLFD